MDKALKFNETDYGGRMIYCSDAAIKPEGKGKGKDGKDSMDKALKFNETDYGGRMIYCSDAANKPEGKGKGKDGKDGKGKDGGDKDVNTVFVRGLPFAATE